MIGFICRIVNVGLIKDYRFAIFPKIAFAIDINKAFWVIGGGKANVVAQRACIRVAVTQFSKQRLFQCFHLQRFVIVYNDWPVESYAARGMATTRMKELKQNQLRSWEEHFPMQSFDNGSLWRVEDMAAKALVARGPEEA